MHVILKKCSLLALAGCLLTVLFFAGCSAQDATVPTTEPTAESTAPVTEPTTTPTETEETVTGEVVPPVTVAQEDLVGFWIAAAEPVTSEDTSYIRTTQAGFYEFEGSSFTYTQVQMVERGTWSQLEGTQTVYRGTYELQGDMLTLHYTEEAGQAVDYTEQVSMLIDRSCADMCVRTPDHPKLGTLMFFRKARSGDPVNSILVLLNGSL